MKKLKPDLIVMTGDLVDSKRYNAEISLTLMRRMTDGVDSSENRFTILLSHRPELFSVYVQHKIDLIFSGHAHGGQVRLPFLGGLVAPGQGFLPKYDGGKYTESGSAMIVSRGLGNSIIPQRLFNRPEVVLVELSQAK